MEFKYSVVCDTLKWIGHDVLADPHEVLGAIKSAGYDGADLPGDLQRANPKTLRPITDSLGLKGFPQRGIVGLQCGHAGHLSVLGVLFLSPRPGSAGRGL